ncbi:GNAT family N-acetyltransferase [Kangiella sediminilitoris]|nr:GNAT family N-acetyltransferase [Kangiella sediminilitoris]
MTVFIKEVPVEDIYPLRNKVLRPGQPVQSCHYDEDSMVGVFHLAAIENNRVVGIASFYPEAHPSLSADNAWRLRGMATDSDVRGQGIGRALLKHGINSCSLRGGNLLWCNARTAALPFYRKLDFEIQGNEFMIENIGPHYLMYYQISD